MPGPKPFKSVPSMPKAAREVPSLRRLPRRFRVRVRAGAAGVEPNARRQAQLTARMRDRQPFPDDFVWGAATCSAYRYEGAAGEDGRGPSVWDTFSRNLAPFEGHLGEVACDHYHRYRDDVALMKTLASGRTVSAFRGRVCSPMAWAMSRGLEGKCRRLVPSSSSARSRGTRLYGMLFGPVGVEGRTPRIG